jgi:nicotinate-nucleotide adenylyltransferase
VTRLGLLGGSFDPIHVGHLAAAEAARDALGLDQVLFVPAGDPPHKATGTVSPAADRAAMVQLAIAGNDAFAMSRVELDRPGPSWTVDTVDHFVERGLPVTLILSAESFAELPGWHEPERLLGRCRIAVVPRGGVAAPDDDWLGRHFPGVSADVVRLDWPRLRLSATEIRGRVAAGRSIRYLVPDAVIAYIGDHGLYRRLSSAPAGEIEPVRTQRS